MPVIGPEGASKPGHSSSTQFWNFKENRASSSVRKDKKRTDAHLTPPNIFKSASYTNLPSKGAAFDSGVNGEKAGIKRTVSDNRLSSSDNGILRRRSLLIPAIPENGTLEDIREHKLIRRKSSRFPKEMKLNGGIKITLAEQQANPELLELPKALLRDRAPVQEIKLRSVTGSLSSLAKRSSSWMGASRSPSPHKRDPMAKEQSGGPPKLELSISAGPFLLDTPTGSKPSSRDGANGKENAESAPSPPLQRKNTTSKKVRRPISMILGKSASTYDEGSKPVVPPLPKSMSADKLAISWHTRNGAPKQQLSRQSSMERMSIMSMSGSDTSYKKDELLSSFKAIDGEYHKFLSKPSMAKANTVRGVLLPFLKTYANHPSNDNLRAGDLERRVAILNRWWGGLLEMLSGRNGQSVSGNDRPAILDGISGIMMRPEWRMPASAISCRAEKRPQFGSWSTTSLASASSDALAESVFHNVRVIFVQNLLSQMVFVVDRMGMRSVPASMVTFCGKATAYAFFFCPGVAEILVRLWDVSLDSVKRVLGEMDISKFEKLGETAESVSSGFPSHLHKLAFKSVPSLMRSLRNRPELPLEVSQIPWYGPWIGRWVGRDSDLFFIFVKYHHILMHDMLPPDATTTERACAPTNVLVQAQFLTVLDATIHRPNNRPHSEFNDGPPPVTFDELLGADVPAAPLPIPAPNASRLMAQNRLIMLLREFLSEISGVNDGARKSFAEMFSNTLKAGSRRTSMFDHTACFALCDFLEEAISILVRFYHDSNDPVSFLDWEFWRGVCEQMMNSNNSMTEVRLYAFIYALWGLITKNSERKKQITVDWLLKEEHFQRQFSHWCPMVRAYYMRLLCWRFARFDGEASELDTLIYSTLTLRLQQAYSHHIYVQEQSERYGTVPPSTIPGTPAPGRRLIIVREDMITGPGDAFLSFDTLLSRSSTTTQPTAYERHSSLQTLKEMSANIPPPNHARSSSPGRRRWSLLRTMNPFTTAEQIRSADSSPDRSGDSGDRPSTGDTLKTPNEERAATSTMMVKSSSSPNLTQAHHPLSFKFSLEWARSDERPPRNRRLQPPRLPLPAQVYLQSQQALPIPCIGVKASGHNNGVSKYCGRALAEWAVLIQECQNFYERRKYEGVVGLKRVETPMLGVEGFRRPG